MIPITMSVDLGLAKFREGGGGDVEAKTLNLDIYKAGFNHHLFSLPISIFTRPRCFSPPGSTGRSQ